MDTKQFIASLVGSLAWPTVVFVIAMVFRKQLAQLLTTGWLRRLKVGAVEAEFGRRIPEVEAKLGVAPDEAEAAEVESLGATVVEELAPVAEVSPSAAVLEAFAKVEQDLQARMQARGFTRVNEPWGALGLARRARAGGLITPESLEAIEGVAVLRNLAAHKPDGVTQEAALEYLGLIDAVLFAIRRGARQP